MTKEPIFKYFLGHNKSIQGYVWKIENDRVYASEVYNKEDKHKPFWRSIQGKDERRYFKAQGCVIYVKDLEMVNSK